MLGNIRNFGIIAHIDHGKSTLADRLLEVTKTIEKRKMKDQVLDQMELERERGITIKMQPVRMEYKNHILNLIDTPGHIDFSYEVSRAIAAVEGAILLVDATQGVQAQTLTVLNWAQEANLVILPVISKIDSPLANVFDVREEIVKLLNCKPEEVLEVSGRTGAGVPLLVEKIIERIPPPKGELTESDSRSLVFDFEYSEHRGVIVYIRVTDGTIRKGDKLIFRASNEKFTALETGVFKPGKLEVEYLKTGEIGYVVTGIKNTGFALIGDTISREGSRMPPLSGYGTPRPVVWASVYPESQDDFPILKMALGRLHLTDPAFTFEEETSGLIGRGFRTGFLGMLHLEIISERLKREFNLSLIITTPSIAYEVTDKNDKTSIIYTPAAFPAEGLIKEIKEPWVKLKIIVPRQYLDNLWELLYDHEAVVGETENWSGDRMAINLEMPLRELMRNFFDDLKSVSSGYASLSYEIIDSRLADVARLDLFVAEELMPAFSKIISRRRIEDEAKKSVEKLYDILPRQWFSVKIQAHGLGRIISSRTLPALKKDVTGYLYGGDRTRKMKLWQKQKKGKKKMQALGKVNIPQDVFIAMMKK
ncbi:elongation factor 4 [Candidatus Nomurabacteria bacterium RIFCSPHIGHO2_01_FULL_39_9]|uniref:Elongation factor 4 n=1 Tax=Candidatus Nomurabacteria bacterium RIFCSPHIGHO2_01_FULL_39_9 TaxID=1801735 RepID=A0A1F6UUZ7_9BACT|nr:MAG: elongation factor 4 [Candidatus Nomurabacteria bacterium RIFCSPHIGHO2_01_FULL_39_9]